MKLRILLVSALLIGGNYVSAQWTNRYPKVDGMNHHVYLEGFELPILTSGPMDPAPSPLDQWLVFSAKGWLWLKNFNNSEATRITFSSGVDSRPEWSPDGKKLVFVRDNGSDTQIVHLNIDDHIEKVLLDEEALDLDPVFSSDGKYVYYSSAVAGTLDIWRIDVETGEKTQITKKNGQQRRPWAHPDGRRLIYLNKFGSYNSIEALDLNTNESTTLVADHLTAQADLSVSLDGYYMAYTWPDGDGYEIRIMDLETPSSSIRLTKSQGMPLAPEFSDDSKWVYYSEANDDERMMLKRISVNGGEPETMAVESWDWHSDTGRLKVTTTVDGVKTPVRLNILDASGHPLIPESGTIRFDGQNGRVFFYADGEAEVIGTPGEVTISAVQGFETSEGNIKAVIATDQTTEVTIDLKRIWDAGANGWYSGDNHFHLNYGGVYRLDPDDIVLDLKGERVDVGIPLLANLHNRFLQQELWGWERQTAPLITFGQEIRSHFLGHLELIGTKELFWPWIWGPYYEVYSRDDRTNASALRFARDQGGFGGYVHPVSISDPFAEGAARSVPISLVADAILDEVDLIEVACLWTDEIGTGSLWHELLNLGMNIAPTGGSDVMNDYFRTMAIGATRVYVKPEGSFNMNSYLKALKDGRSFVSTGPMMEFAVNGSEPGQVIRTNGRKVKWSLDVHSAVPYQTVEIIVNGDVVWSKKGNTLAGSKSYSGSITVPVGGWVTARVRGGETTWPLMDSYPFAETAPVWFGSKGSTDPEVQKKAATKLMDVLLVSEERLYEGYGDAPIPKLERQFQRAEQRLRELINE